MSEQIELTDLGKAEAIERVACAIASIERLAEITDIHTGVTRITRDLKQALVAMVMNFYGPLPAQHTQTTRPDDLPF